MSLLTDIRDFIRANGNLSPYYINDEIPEVRVVQDDIVDTSGRWYNLGEAIFERDGEYVRYEYCEPATEMQSWSDFSIDDRSIFAVIPKEVTMIHYVRV